MSKRDKNLRNAVDTVFRQTTPPTPTRIVKDVLSSGEEQSKTATDSGDSVTIETMAPQPLRAASMVQPVRRNAPEASTTLPPPDVAPIDVAPAKGGGPGVTGSGLQSPSSSTSSTWNVFFVIVLLLAIGFVVWYNYDSLAEWLRDNVASRFSPATTTGQQQQRKSDANVQPGGANAAAERQTNGASPVMPPSISEMIKMTVSSAVKQLPQPGQQDSPRKTVRIDESKNTVRLIDPNAPPSDVAPAAAEPPTATVALTAPPVLVAPPVTVSALPDKSGDGETTAEMIRKLEVSLDNLAKTSMDLAAQRDAAIAATTQKRDGAALRLDEREQFSRSERIAPMPVDAAAASQTAQEIYNRRGENSVVGNRNVAPFVTFAPGEEPFDGMVPDYEAPAGEQTPPPLRSGEPHSIMELVSDHCLRTGKPQPKAADRSTLDVQSKRDTSPLSALRTADCDGHYLQSQRKQFELQRMNQSAVKKIYDAKHASATGQILDRGTTALSSFAGSRGDDAVQYLNVNAL